MDLGLHLGLTAAGGSAPPPFSAIAADGWQATVDSPTDLSLSTFTVTRDGFDSTGTATTHDETMYLTKRVRQVYPNQASFTTDKVTLSDYVYADDVIAGATNSSTVASPMDICINALRVIFFDITFSPFN